MDTQRTLDDIFAAARAEEPVMKREESREVIDRATITNTERGLPWRSLLGLVGFMMVVMVIWFAWPEGEQQKTSDAAKSEQRLTSAETEAASPRHEKLQNNTGQVSFNNAQPLPSHHIETPAANRPEHRIEPRSYSLSDKSVAVNRGVGSIHTIELPARFLDSLGVRSLPDGSVLYHTMYSPGDSVMVLQIHRSIVSAVTVERAVAPRYIPQPQWQHLEPRMITDAKGTLLAKNIFPGDNDLGRGEGVLPSHRSMDSTRMGSLPNQIDSHPDSLASAIRAAITSLHQRLFDFNRLIPVRIHADDSTHYIFWYEPTPELLNLLPSQILVQLRLEAIASTMALYDIEQEESSRMKDVQRLRTILDSLIERRIALGETMPVPDKARSGASIMETGRVTDGSLSLYSISPNPNSGVFRMRYSVRDTRVISIAVYDINGNRLHVTTDGFRTTRVEDHEVVVRITKELSPGIYLLVLSSDKGERAVQRLMIDS